MPNEVHVAEAQSTKDWILNHQRPFDAPQAIKVMAE
jgi:hypothetical protein